MEVCKNCGAKDVEGKKFCPFCGTALIVEQENKEPVAEEAAKEVQPEPVAEAVAEEVQPEAVAEETAEEVQPEAVAEEAAEEVQPEPVAEAVFEEVQPEPDNIPASFEEAQSFEQVEEQTMGVLPDSSFETDTDTKKTDKQPKAKRPIKPTGVAGAAVLSILLIINVVLLLACGVALGFTLEKPQTIMETFGIRGVDGSFVDVFNASKSISGENAVILTEAVESIDVTETDKTVISNFINQSSALGTSVNEGFVKDMKVAKIVVICLTGYIGASVLIILAGMLSCLAWRRKALILPGAIFTLEGLAALCASVALVFLAMSQPVISQILASMPLMNFILMTSSAAVVVIGVALIIIGATGKRKKS